MKIQGEYQDIKIEFEDQWYDVKVEVAWYEENYGEDADGNRGIITKMIDDIVIHEVKKDGVVIEATPELQQQIYFKLEEE